MPPANSSISSRTVMPAGARCTPGFATRPDTEKERNPLRPWRPCAANHSAPFSRMSRTQYSVSMLCSSVGRPNRPTCATYGRAQPRHAALAFDRFDHRRLFAADVGAGAAAQMDARQRAWRVGLERRDLARQDRAAGRVFVAQVDVDVVDVDRPRRDQHAFEEAMRVALEVMPVLERSRLAFVDVDGHQPRRGLGAHDAPLAAGGKAGAAEARAVRNSPLRR